MGSKNLSMEPRDRKVCGYLCSGCMTLYLLPSLFRLVDEFHSQLGGHEVASDGVITDLDYSSEK